MIYKTADEWLDDIVADGGVTVRMVIQRKTPEQAARSGWEAAMDTIRLAQMQGIEKTGRRTVRNGRRKGPSMTDHNARQAGLTLIREKLARFVECVEDDEDTDIGREYLDALTILGLLARTQRSPAQWCITDAGSDFLAAHSADARNGEGVVPLYAMQAIKQLCREIKQSLDIIDKRQGGACGATESIHDKADAIVAVLLAAPAAPAPTRDAHGIPMATDSMKEAAYRAVMALGMDFDIGTKTWVSKAAAPAPAPAAQADSACVADMDCAAAKQCLYGCKQRACQQSATPAAPVLCVSSADFKRLREADAHIKAWLPPVNSALDMPLYATPADAASEADKIDYSLARGDTVYSPYWGDGARPVEVVDVNWALRAAAVRLAPKGGIVVWPVSHLQRERQQGAQGNG